MLFTRAINLQRKRSRPTAIDYRRLPSGLVRFTPQLLFEAACDSARSESMKDLSNAVFPPEVIELMTTAFEAAVATLPEPVHSAYVTIIAESILRTASTGERDAVVLERIALMELRLALRR